MGGLSRSVEKRRIGSTNKSVWFQSSPAPSISHTERPDGLSPAGPSWGFLWAAKWPVTQNLFGCPLEPSKKKVPGTLKYIYKYTKHPRITRAAPLRQSCPSPGDFSFENLSGELGNSIFAIPRTNCIWTSVPSQHPLPPGPTCEIPYPRFAIFFIVVFV